MPDPDQFPPASPARSRGTRPPRAGRPKRLPLAVLAGAASGGLLLATGASAAVLGRAGPAPGSPVAFGTVSSVERPSRTFEVKAAGGKEVTVRVTSSTSYVDPAVKAPGFADLRAGETVVVSGSSASGAVTATRVNIGKGGGPGTGAPGPGGRFPGGAAPVAFGAVASVDATADTFEVTAQNGRKVTVHVTSSTTYRDASKAATFAALKAGQQVAVFGSRSSGKVTATQVMVGSFGRPGGAGAPSGEPPAKS